MKEGIMLSEEFWGRIHEKLNEEAWILDMINAIVENAATDLASTIGEGKRIFDLGDTINRRIDNWKFQMKRAIEENEKNEK